MPTLIAAALVAVLGAHAAEPAPGKLGGSAQKLVVVAANFARANWKPDACLAGVETSFGFDIMSRSSEDWEFQFYSESEPLAPKCVEFAAGLPKFEDMCLNVSPHCIHEMTVDSGRAVDIAMRRGLLYGVRIRTTLRLMRLEERAEGPAHLFWRTLPHLRGRTVWQVFTLEWSSDPRKPSKVDVRGREFLIDAKTGRVLYQK